jgi:hypothetical protein
MKLDAGAVVFFSKHKGIYKDKYVDTPPPPSEEPKYNGGKTLQEY